MTRDEIVGTVWKGRIVSESAISARIAAARKAVGGDGKRQAINRTVARRGLQMVAEVVRGPETAPAAPQATEQRIRYTQSDTGHALAYSVSGEGSHVARVAYLGSDMEAERSVRWNTCATSRG